MKSSVKSPSSVASVSTAADPAPLSSARQLALNALRQIHQGAYADVMVDRILSRHRLNDRERRLFTELVYGAVRRMRTLDAVIDRLAKKPASQQPPNLRSLLHVGLYQLLFLDHIPSSAAVDTTVELAKHNGMSGLTGFVNGLLRRLVRETTQVENGEGEGLDEFEVSNLDRLLATTTETKLGVHYSFPDWITALWVQQFGPEEAEALCEWMNQPPHLDLRISRGRDLDQVTRAFEKLDIIVTRLEQVPMGLRLSHSPCAIQDLPGFTTGDWVVQDASAQLVSYLVDPQPGECVADVCAAPGGKTLHLAELMDDRGRVIALDKTASRLKKVKQNCERLGIQSIEIREGDARLVSDYWGQCDRVLVDAPCSGLGTLNRHADARWRQTEESVAGLAKLQQEILTAAAKWVKPEGKLIYSTCTLHPLENTGVVEAFLAQHPDWQIDRVESSNPVFPLMNEQGWVQVLPHEQDMDGFFMVRFRRSA